MAAHRPCWLAGTKMIVDHHNLVRIPDLLKSHLIEFIYNKRHHDVVEHDAIDIDRHDLARLLRRLSADIIGR